MKKIDNREFVVTWMTSQTVEDVARNLGMKDKQAAMMKAVYLRKLGVELPKKGRAGKVTKLEIAQLNSLIKKHLKSAV